MIQHSRDQLGTEFGQQGGDGNGPGPGASFLVLLKSQSPFTSPTDFAKVARAEFARRDKGHKNKTFKWVDKEICSSLIGTSHEVCSELWNLSQPLQNVSKSAEPKHLLWSLFFMKSHSVEAVSTRVVGVDNKTFRKWAWIFVFAIKSLKSEVTIWDNRFRNWDQKATCLASVDGTDCPIKEPWPFDASMCSQKLNGPGCKHEVAVATKTCDTVRINGPFKAGTNESLALFSSSHFLIQYIDSCCCTDFTRRRPRGRRRTARSWRA